MADSEEHLVSANFNPSSCSSLSRPQSQQFSLVFVLKVHTQLLGSIPKPLQSIISKIFFPKIIPFLFPKYDVLFPNLISFSIPSKSIYFQQFPKSFSLKYIFTHEERLEIKVWAHSKPFWTISLLGFPGLKNIKEKRMIYEAYLKPTLFWWGVVAGGTIHARSSMDGELEGDFEREGRRVDRSF